jgi:TonB-dependent receptor
VGLSQKDYEYDLLAANRNLNLHGDPQGIVVVPPGCGIQQSDIVVTADQGFVRKDWQGQEYILIRWDAFADALGFPGNGNTAGDPCFEISPGSSGRRNVKESDFGYYAQMDFHTQLGTMDFFGNVGLRNVTTDVDSTGDIATEPVTVKKSYSDSLPSMNLGLWVTDEVVLRAAWAKVMARPDLGDISPGGSVDGFNRRYTAGNPGLEPFRADAFDLAVEWYFGEESLLSLAFFQKDIASFPEQVTETVTWQSLGLPDSLLDNSPATPQDLFDYTAKQTGAGGTLHGLELQLQTPFAFGPAWFQDFGTRLSYTDITSDVEYGTTRGRLLNQSDTAYNFTLWYENDSGFAGRVTFSHIGDSATRIPSRFTIPGGVDAGEDINAALDYVSAKFSYQINEQLSVSLEGLNLTDERTHSLMGSNGFLLEDTSNGNGPQYFIGAQYFFR